MQTDKLIKQCPLEPSEELVWPDSWSGAEIAALKSEAERVWRSMWLAVTDGEV